MVVNAKTTSNIRYAAMIKSKSLNSFFGEDAPKADVLPPEQPAKIE